eukprot:TRINITY_DN94_c0_g1_i6.p1 TRINITY_DN94_c0_g1~~TRINITY_DN94_c0_g1_i6.p1  ORF type:complete len:67 (+),score=12.35 TRINITY_DN94_c0_g1_i6:195-395(+)
MHHCLVWTLFAAGVLLLRKLDGKEVRGWTLEATFIAAQASYLCTIVWVFLVRKYAWQEVYHVWRQG